MLYHRCRRRLVLGNPICSVVPIDCVQSADLFVWIGCATQVSCLWRVPSFIRCLLGTFVSLCDYMYISAGWRVMTEGGRRSLALGDSGCFSGGALSAVHVQCARSATMWACPAEVETHILWYFGHHRCLVVGFDALGIWHFWMFTLFHPFLLFCTHFPPISTTSTLFLG